MPDWLLESVGQSRFSIFLKHEYAAQQNTQKNFCAFYRNSEVIWVKLYIFACNLLNVYMLIE